MNKKLVLFFFALLMQPSVVMAAASGSGKTLGQNEFAVGIDYNTIFNMEMKPNDGANNRTSDIEGSDQIYGTVTYGVFNNDRFSADVTGKLGAADLTLESLDTTFFNTEEIRYEKGLLWGAGGRVAYRLEKEVAISLHGQYNQWESDLDSITYRGQRAYNISGGTKARVSEFQAAVLLTYESKNTQTGLTFVPYAGPYINLTKVKTGEITYETANIRSGPLNSGVEHADDPYGFILGLEIYGLNDKLKLSIEGRFRYEQALTLSFHYNF